MDGPDIIGFLIAAFLIVQGIVMLVSGKVFFFNNEKYSDDTLMIFAKKAGPYVTVLGIGILLFQIGISISSPAMWMVIVGLIIAIICVIIYIIMMKKYLK